MSNDELIRLSADITIAALSTDGKAYGLFEPLHVQNCLQAVYEKLAELNNNQDQ